MGGRRLSLLCVGDLAFMDEAETYDPSLPPADVSTGNVEIVLSDRPGFPAEKLVHLLAGEDTASAYARLGLDVVTLANNHTLDYGPAGLASTIEALQAQDVAIVGAGIDAAAARMPIVVEAEGVRFGFLGVSCVAPGFAATSVKPGVWVVRVRAYAEIEASNEQPGAAPFVHTVAEPGDVEALRGAVRSLREDVDVVVLHIHWGVPPPWQTPFQGALATYQRRLVIDLGDDRPDIIVGHHPHVLHGVEWVGGTLVMYSLGHLVFQPWGTLFAARPDALILDKAAEMGAAALHSPYESLEDDRNWDGGVAVVELEMDPGRPPRVVACRVFPYAIDRSSGLGLPATEPGRAQAILNQVAEHSQRLSEKVSVEFFGLDGGPDGPMLTIRAEGVQAA